MSRALVIGCGGTLGAAWCVAALKALADQWGWDPREADVLLGTSGGAELVTMLGSGISVDELVAMQRGESTDPRLAAHFADVPGMLPPLPRLGRGSPKLVVKGRGLAALSGLAPRGGGDAGWLSRLATSLNPDAAWPQHPGVRVVAADYATGKRVVFGAPGSPAATIEQALRASWAIPGWFPPVQIGGRRYVDGGVVSTASVDLVGAVDEIVVIAPMASVSGARRWRPRLSKARVSS